MHYNKESILNQIEIAEYNIRRLKTLVEVDLVEGSVEVPMYCCMMASNQLLNIRDEINGGSPEQPKEVDKKLNLKLKKA